MKKIFLSVAIIGLAVNISGCASSQQTLSTDPLCLPNTLNEQAMLKAQAVLEKMHFDIEKFDPEAGYIRTRPLSGAQFFEFWRQDNASAQAAAQANLHSLQRVAELEFTPQNTTTCVQCRVQVLRLSIPERPVEGNRQIASIYTDSSYREQSLQMDPDDLSGIEWIDVGPDRDLERKILKLIQKEIE